LLGVAWSVSTNTVSWAGVSTSPAANNPNAVALRHDESLGASGSSGSWSAASVSALSTTAPSTPSNPPKILHQDSSRDGCNTRNRSTKVRCSSCSVIRRHRAASLRTPETSRCRSNSSVVSAVIREAATTRSNDASPSRRTSRSSGRYSVLRAVCTRSLAAPGDPSPFTATQSVMARAAPVGDTAARSRHAMPSSVIAPVDLVFDPVVGTYEGPPTETRGSFRALRTRLPLHPTPGSLRSPAVPSPNLRSGGLVRTPGSVRRLLPCTVWAVFDAVDTRRSLKILCGALVFTIGAQSIRFLFGSMAWYLRD